MVTPYEGVRGHTVDLSGPNSATVLEPALRGADVVVHLTLAVHPVRYEDYLYRANVIGTQVVLTAMTAAGVGQLVYASSLGIYARGSGAPVAEDWPTTGQATTSKARRTLGWTPTRLSTEIARELIEGLAKGSVGTSAMGWQTATRKEFRGTIDRAYDVTLMLCGVRSPLCAPSGGVQSDHRYPDGVGPSAEAAR